jgi:hypothetical protein
MAQSPKTNTKKIKPMLPVCIFFLITYFVGYFSESKKLEMIM